MGLSRSLQAMAAAENRERFGWAIIVRWLVIGGFLALALTARVLGRLASVEACLMAATVGSFVNAVNRWSLRHWRFIGVVSVGAVVGDVVLISWVVVGTGGLRSPFVMMYVVQVVTTALLLDMGVAAVSALLCVGGFIAALQVQRLLGAEAGWLPASTPAAVATDHLVWALFLLYCLALLVYLGGYISDRLRISERDLAAKNDRLQRTLSSLEEAHTTLQATYDRLRSTESQLVQSEKIRALGQLVAGIAHELNNPISFVYANVDYVRRSLKPLVQLLSAYDAAPLTPVDRARLVLLRERLRVDTLLDDLPQLLTDCEEGVRRAQEIVTGLQTFARIEREDCWQLADLHAALDASLTLLRHRLPPGVTVERRYGVLPLVECLPGQLTQVFVNVLANAADAVGKEGRVTIQTEILPPSEASAVQGSPRAAVTISDDGPGIPAEALPHVFEPFFTTKEVGKGVGLGLSVSHGIVQRHRGELRAHSTVGAGTAFTIVIPIAAHPNGPR